MRPMTAPPPPADSLRIAGSPAAPSIVALWLAGAGLLWALYAFVFVGTTNSSVGQAVGDAFCNVLPLSLLAIGVRAVLKAEVMRRSTATQTLCHAALAIVFSFTWYATLVLLLALSGDLRGWGLRITGFHGPALTWQVFQGLLIYVAVAATCYAVRGGREAASVTIVEESQARPALTRYLIRQGEALTPVSVEEIVSISGAQDYAEVLTATGSRHLVRLSLAELEARLDPAQFVRVHRSALINLHRLVRTEPAGGGRLLAHMQGGETVPVSRTGVQMLRRFVV